MERTIRFVSTRGGGTPVSLRQAVERSLAPDGGLYVPERFPSFRLSDFDGREDPAQVAEILLRPFFSGDPLASELRAICAEVFAFPIPLRHLDSGTAVLELFHGPTAAFKDVGARFLAACLRRLSAGEGIQRTVLVATSGDTGGAVAAAFHGRKAVEVVILFPHGMVSPLQERQLTGWGGNVRALAVRGSFDHCQRMVKEALARPDRVPGRLLCSANSISLARLLPQISYHAAASLQHLRSTGEEAGIIVPSGNLGNAVAALWGRKMGFPIREVVLATNANRPLHDFLAGGAWRPAPAVATLASAMDVGDPSNMERLLHLFGGEAPARRALRGWSIQDDEIRETIRRGAAEWGRIWDPHTAAAVATRTRLESPHWIIVSTAHPAKFRETVEPLVGRPVPLPPTLAELPRHPPTPATLEPETVALLRELDAH